MEAMGADVSHKIRSAIKAKLIELGVYIDDELPDYIMVMVANKKTKMQMDEDLNLFLAANTTKFTTWLHEVLQRLQSVTTDAGYKKNNLAVDSRKQVEPKTMKTNIIQQETDTYDEKDEILAIKAEQEEDDLLAEELASNKPNDSSPAKDKRKQNVVSPIQRTRTTSRDIEIINLQPIRATKRPVPITVQPIPRKRRAPSSTVGAVLSRPVESDEEEVNFRSTGIASVVKISERRSSVPPELQANKNLIMRAVAEAKKSMLEASKKNLVEIPIEFNTRPQLFTRKHRSMLTTNPNAAVVLPRKSVVDVHKFDDAYPNIVEDDRPQEQMLIDEEMNNKRCIIVDDNDNKTVASPTFIVTLDGVDPATFASKQFTSVLKATNSECELIDLDDDDEVMLVDNDDDMEDGEKESSAKSTERCKYWPTCKNGNECPYQHPSKQCKTFPNCRFGDKCHYIHPNCKYDATCMRQNCPFTHASRRVLNQVPTPVVFASKLNLRQKEQLCKFYPKCSNLNCTFYHPKPCRYGFSCTQSGCSFFHPPLPSRDKLRWTPTTSSQSATVNSG